MKLLGLLTSLVFCLGGMMACGPEKAASKATAARAVAEPAGSNADDAARFLAGLPGREGSAFKALEGEAAWQEHATEMGKLWDLFQNQRRPAMAKFAESELKGDAQGPRPVWYPFSGGDALTMLTFYPGRTLYSMAALEPPGRIPSLSDFPAETVAEQLAGVRTSLQSLLQKSFFVTREMDRQLRGQLTDGVAEPILVLLARSGYQITGHRYVQLDENGVVVPRTPGAKRSEYGLNRGLELDIQMDGAPAAKLFYLSLNLDNAHMKHNAAFHSYVRALGKTETLLKATSYMLHADGFSDIRGLILECSGLISQDDSGIPWRFLNDGDWEVTLYGDYVQPFGKSFEFRKQPDLRAAYEEHKSAVKPLGFRIGYGAGRVTSNQQVARRKG